VRGIDRAVLVDADLHDTRDDTVERSDAILPAPKECAMHLDRAHYSAPRWALTTALRNRSVRASRSPYQGPLRRTPRIAIY